MRWCVLLLCALKFATGQNCRGDEPRNRDCENLCDKNGKNCRINAAVLLPQNSSFLANLPSVRPVFDLALADDVIKNAFPPDLYVNLTTYDVTDCDAAYAVISAIDAYNDCAHVFFGPSCDFALASVARITKFLGSTGTPLITTGGFTFDFVKQKQTCLDEFYMMVRAGPVGFKDLAYFLIDLFRHFNWRQLLLINDPEAQVNVAGKSTCHLMMKTFANYLKLEEIMYIPWDTTSDGGQNYTENLKFYLGYKYTNLTGPVQRCFSIRLLLKQKLEAMADIYWPALFIFT
ncbi:uncharacterized protein LOC114357069 isoform X1 [Ostrinia furnacalis]|uniref:uncharacterized protein LOC114357069 isoform X1 n=1 Tax=Ostrinia furnacalis TaxID=93504 RepID=UPI00103FFAFC|nr:uncharacterized protein LOC114357069 isoform X1 [Ostrinia furnacalis]